MSQQPYERLCLDVKEAHVTTRTHRTEQQTRELVVASVLRQIADHGVPVSADLPMEQIIEAAGVSRASAYRIWRNRAEFQAFAIDQALAVHSSPTLGREEVVAIARRAVLPDDRDRRACAARFIADSADAELTIFTGSERWRAFVAVRALAMTSPDPGLRERLAQIDTQDRDRLTGHYRTIAHALELQPIDPEGVEHLAGSALQLARGTLGHLAGDTADTHALRTGYLTGLVALVRGTFADAVGGAIDPDWGTTLTDRA